MRLFLVLAVVVVMASCSGTSGPVKEYAFHVYGNCDKCKKRIDSAATINGVKLADWHIDSKLITIQLDTNVTSASEVLQSVAHAGHDNEIFYANDYAYGSLPTTCQYERREHELK